MSVIRKISLVSLLLVGTLFVQNARAVVWEQIKVEDGRGEPRWVQIVPISGSDDMGIIDYYSGDDYAIHYLQGNKDDTPDMWQRSTVVDHTTNDRPGLTISPDGVPYVSYQKTVNGAVNGDDTQFVAHWTGWETDWETETVVEWNANGGSSIAFDPTTGQPVVAFGGHYATYAWRNEVGWSEEAIETHGGDYFDPSLVFDPISNEPTVAFSHNYEGLKFFRRSDPDWIVNGIADSRGFDTVLAYSPTSNLPAVAYTPGGGEVPIYFAEWDPDADEWWSEVAVSGATEDQFGFAFTSTGLPVIAYTPYDAQSSVRVMFREDGDWNYWCQFLTDSSVSAVNLALPGDLMSANITYLTHDTWLATPIPEPATVALLGLGSLSLLCRRRK